MTRLLVHRGPDDSDFYHDDLVSFGHRRLSINDLESGRQPITNETGDLVLVCNGEIYNSPRLRAELIQRGHQFKTKTDVEVILHLYEEHGVDCVKHLQGMFAFALWNAREKSLFLARDHVGQKPLFYRLDDTGLIFASEVKAVLEGDEQAPELEIEALWHYMSMRYMPDELSLFRNIRKLPAGSWLLWQAGQVTTRKFWDINYLPKHSGSFQEVVGELDSLFRETVESHLLSDVRVGGFLSGGIDSSLIMAVMSQASTERVPSFSIGVNESGFNELPYARMVSEQYNLEAHEEVVNADLIGLMPDMIHHLDEPADPYGVGVYLASQVAKDHVKVVLTGDGGDECFGGYDRFFGQRLADYYAMMPRLLRKEVMGRLIGLIPESFGYNTFSQKARWLNEMSMYERGDRYANSMSTLRFTTESKDKLFTSDAIGQIKCHNSNEKILHYFDANNAKDIVDRMLYTDMMTRLPDHLLTVSDRMSMAHSLESRAPFVDHRLVEFAARIRANHKVSGPRLKYVLRQLSARYLSPVLVKRKKQGFGFPLGRWLRSDLAGFMTALFAESRFVQSGLFNRGYIDSLVAEHISGKTDHNYRLWMLINLEFWYRIYFEQKSLDEIRGDIERLRA